MNLKPFSFGENEKYLKHCDERWREKINQDSTRLLTLLDILNREVPEDWRLSRFSPDFLIEDFETNAVLVGSQYRTKDRDTVYKEIYTVLKHGDSSRDKLTRNYCHARAGRPNLVIYNDGVYARQYEKVATKKLKPCSVQYFRMNPLTKEGLQDNPQWLKWGNLITPEWTVKEEIATNYHGEDYWSLPIM